MYKEFADAISRAHEAAKKRNGNVILSSEISRADRELLVSANWLQEIIRGWYMLVRPGVQPGDTSVWYANFWDFVRIYLEETYGSNYCLSAENSIDIHIGNPLIPKQVIVITRKGGGKPVNLPFDTSILAYQDLKNFPPEQMTVLGLRVMTLPYALCKSTPTYFLKNETNVQIALGMIRDFQELIYIIATYNFVRSGERIIGAFIALHEEEKAGMIREQLKRVGMNLQGRDPFASEPVIASLSFQSPHQGRILNLWATLRLVVIQNFPSPSGISKDKSEYLHQMEELYITGLCPFAAQTDKKNGFIRPLLNDPQFPQQILPA